MVGTRTTVSVDSVYPIDESVYGLFEGDWKKWFVGFRWPPFLWYGRISNR